MLSASFFEAHKQGKKEMDGLFRELGYTTKQKKVLLEQVFGKKMKLSDMTIAERETINDHLRGLVHSMPTRDLSVGSEVVIRMKENVYGDKGKDVPAEVTQIMSDNRAWVVANGENRLCEKQTDGKWYTGQHEVVLADACETKPIRS